MAYADADDLADRFDENTIKDIASDTGEPVDDISNDTKIQAALDDASGRVDAACTVSHIYSVTDLTSLTGTNLALLKRITCELTMAFLIGRRPEKFGGENTRKIQQSAEDYLDRLRKGERLFGLTANQDAGLPTVDGPTSIEYTTLNLIPDRTNNFYPGRQSRLPTNRV